MPDLLEARRSRIGRWAGAALVVCALHIAGAALAVMHWQEEDAADDVAGGFTVELALLPAPAPVDSPDVAHGPLKQEAKLTPEASKGVVEKVEKDIRTLPGGGAGAGRWSSRSPSIERGRWWTRRSRRPPECRSWTRKRWR